MSRSPSAMHIPKESHDRVRSRPPQRVSHMRSFSVVSSQDAEVDTEMVITDVAVVIRDAGGLPTVGLATLDARMGR